MSVDLAACSNGSCLHVAEQCVECEGHSCEGLGRHCDDCGVFWCSDWKEAFFEGEDCDHHKTTKTICPQCYFANSLYHCTEQECPWNPEKARRLWSWFCGGYFECGAIQGVRQQLGIHTLNKISISFPRVQRDGKSEIDLWRVDRAEVILSDDDFDMSFTGTQPLAQALDIARIRIQKLENEGFVFERLPDQSPGLLKQFLVAKCPVERCVANLVGADCWAEPGMHYHCDDCGWQLKPDEVTRCALCPAKWCKEDADQMFFVLSGDIPFSGQSICPQCFFVHPEYHVLNWSSSFFPARALDRWLKYCFRWVPIMETTMANPLRDVFFECKRRHPGNPVDIWPLDTTICRVGSPHEERVFYGPQAIRNGLRYWDNLCKESGPPVVSHHRFTIPCRETIYE